MAGKEKALDFASLDTTAACDKGFDLELRHPKTGEGLGCGVRIVGKDSEVFREHNRALINARIRANAMRQRRNKDPEVITVDRMEADAINLLAACTMGFWGGVMLDGVPLEFSEENARKFYARFPWVREQVDEAIGDLENFMTA